MQNGILLPCLYKYTIYWSLCKMIFYYFFSSSKSERKDWILIVICEEREMIKKYIYIYIYFNKIDNHMWVFWKKMLAKIERVDFILK